MTVGDLSAMRDICDIRDVVAAFPLLLEKGQTGEAYNAGRGEAFRIQDLLDRLLKLAAIPIEVRQKVEPGRKADTTATKADTRKLHAATGWTPRIPLDTTLLDVLNDWRQQAG